MNRIRLTLTREELQAIVWASWAVEEDTVQRVQDAPESDGYTSEDIDYVVGVANTLDEVAVKAQRLLNEEEA